VTTTTPGMRLPPGGRPRLAVGSWRVDPAQSDASFAASVVGRPVRGRLPLWRATGRLQVKNAEYDLACRLALHLGGTRPDGSPCILITSSWVIDSRWITRQWTPGLGRRIVMTCSCSLQLDM
jgi:hypothetical protein